MSKEVCCRQMVEKVAGCDYMRCRCGVSTMPNLLLPQCSACSYITIQRSLGRSARLTNANPSTGALLLHLRRPEKLELQLLVHSRAHSASA